MGALVRSPASLEARTPETVDQVYWRSPSASPCVTPLALTARVDDVRAPQEGSSWTRCSQAFSLLSQCAGSVRGGIAPAPLAGIVQDSALAVEDIVAIASVSRGRGECLSHDAQEYLGFGLMVPMLWRNPVLYLLLWLYRGRECLSCKKRGQISMIRKRSGVERLLPG